jgi:hypothetical protein
VSFTALPFLPWGIRSIGAVDGARVSLGAFQLPSSSSSSSSSRSGGALQVCFTTIFFCYLMQHGNRMISCC